MEIIDTHAHPFDEAFDMDRDQVMDCALRAGVSRIMCPAIDSSSHERLFKLCDTYPEACLPMMGLHPTSVNDNPDWRGELEKVEGYLAGAAGRKFYAVGEVGIDLYWSRDWLREQEEAFTSQVEMSVRYRLPLVIHTRDAWPQVTEILHGFRGRGLRGIMHAFGGSWEDYARLKGLGDFMFGIGGTVTYKKSPLPEIVARMPLGDIVLETDSPYLSPTPFRGKRNEPSNSVYVCEKVAQIKGLGMEEVAAATTANARRMFGI